VPCDILLLGEAPGMTENLTGEAFCGQAGMLLDRMLSKSGLDKLRLFFTNCVLCRPCDFPVAPNRPPTAEEILNCASNVNEIITMADPSHVILLGDYAKTYFKKEFPDSTHIIHPSAVLRTGSESSPYYLTAVRQLEQVYINFKRGAYNAT
jgi:uracil-DNA glycosylase family 4